MKIISKTILASAFVAASGVAQAEITANIAAVSDYMFRGVSQSSNAAIQGGMDYANESGFYAGTWMSNIDLVVRSKQIYMPVTAVKQAQ